ncbi:hypothetical protein J6590_025606 [Homalodisca vitripennis]|nr:hypothetical protein J6590_025606 [Homalodisca vitripennis]
MRAPQSCSHVTHTRVSNCRDYLTFTLIPFRFATVQYMANVLVDPRHGRTPVQQWYARDGGPDVAAESPHHDDGTVATLARVICILYSRRFLTVFLRIVAGANSGLVAHLGPGHIKVREPYFGLHIILEYDVPPAASCIRNTRQGGASWSRSCQGLPGRNPQVDPRLVCWCCGHSLTVYRATRPSSPPARHPPGRTHTNITYTVYPTSEQHKSHCTPGVEEQNRGVRCRGARVAMCRSWQMYPPLTLGVEEQNRGVRCRGARVAETAMCRSWQMYPPLTLGVEEQNLGVRCRGARVAETAMCRSWQMYPPLTLGVEEQNRGVRCRGARVAMCRSWQMYPPLTLGVEEQNRGVRCRGARVAETAMCRSWQMYPPLTLGVEEQNRGVRCRGARVAETAMCRSWQMYPPLTLCTHVQHCTLLFVESGTEESTKPTRCCVGINTAAAASPGHWPSSCRSAATSGAATHLAIRYPVAVTVRGLRGEFPPDVTEDRPPNNPLLRR